MQFYADMADRKVTAKIGRTPDELEKSYGAAVGDMSRRLDFYARRVWLQFLATMALFVVIFVLHGKLSLFVSVIVGVVSNLLTVVVLSNVAAGGPRRFINERRR